MSKTQTAFALTIVALLIVIALLLALPQLERPARSPTVTATLPAWELESTARASWMATLEAEWTATANAQTPQS